MINFISFELSKVWNQCQIFNLNKINIMESSIPFFLLNIIILLSMVLLLATTQIIK